MPNLHSLKKVSKHISKSKGIIHVKGRKFKQLERATLRDQKLQSKRNQSQKQREKELSVVKFLQGKVLSSQSEILTLAQMKEFLEEFVLRYDEEVEQMQAERRPGSALSNKGQLLIQAAKDEKIKFETGYKIPDLSDKNTVEKLRTWNGTPGGTSVMKFIYVSKDTKALPLKEEAMV
ncbi:uncharacterized protein PRCAT00002890001 [Priceomyces carsonii]|uniref:uncharacterized protein n=1 Tax=Priceomyces carsonii TaxID=28549 RepID=UPI002EDA2419|nr:unnamed protein product [Priceomyces carsonii]